MPPRPLHRWKSFWLGILVIVFLGWSWVRSMSHNDRVVWIDSGRREIVIAGSADARIYFTKADNIFGFDPEFSLESLPAVSAGPWLPEAWGGPPVLEWVGKGMAHWFLILLFLIPWTAFLLWRARRLKRLAVPSQLDRDG